MDATDANSNTDPGSGRQSLAAPIIECSPLAMVEVAGPDHRVCFVNPAFCRLLQKTRAELIGKPFAEIVRNGDQCVPLLNRVYETGEFETHAVPDRADPAQPFWLYAMWPALGAGERPERVVIQLTKAPDPHPTLSAMNEALLISGLRQHELREAAEQANAALALEVAERRAAVAALRAANAELRIAQNRAGKASQAKDDFFAALSHELRTPLAPVLITAGSLREDQRLPADIRDELAMIERNVALEARLIDDLLDVTRIAHGKLRLRLQSCDTATLIGYVVEIVQPDARLKDIAMECNYAAHAGDLIGDPARLQQVIWNLLRNAVRFTPPGGRISVATHDIAGPEGQSWLRIEVSDSGIGIDPARLDRIFVPFDQGGGTGSGNTGGLGLGLSIARAVVAMHGGRIVAHSAGLNRGSTFAVELPRNHAFAEPASGSIAAVHDSLALASMFRPAAPLRLLLVEDHAATLRAVTRLLRRDGHTVVAVGTLADAVKAAELDQFDCVVSDIGLPDGSGIELMKTLRTRHGLRGIALSGYGMEADLMQAREAGFFAHLTKPVAISELRSVIASVPRRPHDADRTHDESDRAGLPDHSPPRPES